MSKKFTVANNEIRIFEVVTLNAGLINEPEFYPTEEDAYKAIIKQECTQGEDYVATCKNEMDWEEYCHKYEYDDNEIHLYTHKIKIKEV